MNILWWHIHRDPDWQVEGGYRYDACPCGARRVRLYQFDLHCWLVGPRRSGWPQMRDKHNRRIGDSGWWLKPADGWREEAWDTCRPGGSRPDLPHGPPPSGPSGVSRSWDSEGQRWVR